MPFYTVRTNCEYSITVEAASADEAVIKAGNTDLDEWNKAWAPAEAEPDDDTDDLAGAAHLSRIESSACDR